MLVVDPNVYYEAAKTLAGLAADISTAVTRDLVPGLTNSAGMGGNYSAVQGWNSLYHKHAGEVRTAVLAYAGALVHFGDILNIAGYNWDAAEYNANPSTDKGDPPSHPVLGATTPLGAVGFPEIPNPNGDNGAGLVIAPAWQPSTPWPGAPNGNADGLADTAITWITFANSGELVASPVALRAVHTSFNSVEAPEKQDIQKALDALRGGAEEIGSVARTLAAKLGTHHDRLIDARQQLSSAASGAFPRHPNAQVATATDYTSVQVSIAASLSAIDVINAADTFRTTANNTALYTETLAIDYARPGFVNEDALRNLPNLLALQELPLLVESGNENDNRALIGDMENIATWKTPAATLTAADLSALDAYGPQMKNWAIMAVKYGNEAGVDPRLVLAMALQEGAPLRSGVRAVFYDSLQEGPSSYHPNSELGIALGLGWDKARIEADERGYSKNGAGNSIGLTNLKPGPFNEVMTKYGDKFNGEQWTDLMGNSDLSMKVTAYNLKMLNDEAASVATPEVRASQPHDQFLGSGYNAGGMVDRSLSIAQERGEFEPEEVEHGQSTVNVVKLANQILVESGAYR